jgi:hypothetical protein
MMGEERERERERDDGHCLPAIYFLRETFIFMRLLLVLKETSNI